ncbi:MAG: sigma-54 dependent transcriptional regulator [Planctomycetota bacterium]
MLVVDDERDLAESCAYLLSRAGFESSTAFSGDEALQQMEGTHFDLVVTDVRMPRVSGVELLAAIKERDPDVEVILITGHPGVETAVEALRRGAFDYLTKPFDEQQLVERASQALTHRSLTKKNRGFRERLRAGSSGRQLVFCSDRFRACVETLERAARTDASVLIQGESGTGKELLAHHLHDCSPRADRRFVPVDCATMPENLVESGLFGHTKGAFSGAVGPKAGLFEVASGGTLFLDEIGELPLPFQAKLLRAIQERQIRRVGSTETVDVDVRIVCATNRNLQKEVEIGAFRQDLYYRLDVVRLDVPPLRERVADVALLVDHFASAFATSGSTITVSPEAREALVAYPWPGNVRQLRNALERAVALGDGSMLRLEDLPSEVLEDPVAPSSAIDDGGQAPAADPGESFQEMKARKVAALETTYLRELLTKHHGNVTHSAEDAGMSRSAFQKLMQRYGIRSSDFRS